MIERDPYLERDFDELRQREERELARLDRIQKRELETQEYLKELENEKEKDKTKTN